MPSPIAAVFQQNAWATERLIEVCAQLTDEQLDTTVEAAYGSIRETLTHLLSAEQYYLTRLGYPYPPERVAEGSFAGWDVMAQAARLNGERFAEAASEAPDLVVQGVATDGFADADAAVFLVQAINHSTEHRTQVMTALSRLGAGPADLDAQLDGWSWGEASGALRPKPSDG